MSQRQKEAQAKSTLAISNKEREGLIYAYVDAGFTLTPLSGKIPLVKDWVKTKYDPLLSPSEIAGNFGIVLQEDDIIVDVDPRNFPKGDNPLKRLIKDIGIGLTSFTVKTGGGGLHIYMKKPADLKIRGGLPEYPGIEFKTKGQQVVGAGCSHESGNFYNIAKLTPDFTKKAPESLLKLIERKAVLNNSKGTTDFSDDEQSESRFIKYLLTCFPAVEGDRGDVQTYKTACRGRDFALSPQKTFELMAEHWNPRCQPPWDLEDLKFKVDNAYRYNVDIIGKNRPEADFDDIISKNKEKDNKYKGIRIVWDSVIRNGEAVFKPNSINNAVSFLVLEELSKNNGGIYPNPVYDILHYNKFTNDIEFVRPAPWHKGKEADTWTDSDAIYYKYWLANTQLCETSVSLCHEAATIVAKAVEYHPVCDYLKSLKWDGKKRLDNWLTSYAGVEDNEYSRAVGKKVLVGAVARVFNPGCKFDYMLILEGKQGIGKSTLVSILGGKFYGDINITDSDKDTIETMRGKWVIEVSEMVCSRRVEVDKLKSFLSKTTDRVRLSYRRNAEDFPRQSIFIGTTNPEEGIGYLKDTTGNRRFWPVICTDVNFDTLKADRDQLWAEAVANYKVEPLYLSPYEQKLAEEEAEKRRQKDPWTEAIKDWLDRADSETREIRMVVTSKEILEECIALPVSRITNRETHRVSNILIKELHWDKGKFYHKKFRKVVNGYKKIVDISDIE